MSASKMGRNRPGASGREIPTGNHIERMLQLRVHRIDVTRCISLCPYCGRFSGGHTEYENVVVPHLSLDLDIRSIECSDGQCSIQSKLHVARTRGLSSSG